MIGAVLGEDDMKKRMINQLLLVLILNCKIEK